MTPEQLQQYRDRLAAARQPEHRGDQYAHPHGWNDALDFAERVLKEVVGER